MTLRVGLNVLHLVPGETGGGEIYVRRLIPELLSADPDLELTLFASHEAAGEDWPDPVRVVEIGVSGRSRAQRVLAEQTLLPRAARRAHIDLLHNTFTTAPAVPGVPQVTTILDVIYKRFPETHHGLLAYGMRLLVPLAAKRSRRILTLSEAVKADIVAFLDVPADRVDVTYLGPGMRDGVAPVPEAELRERLSLGAAPVVLCVAARRPHKNLERLIDAFAEIDTDPRPVLVVTGYKTAFEDDSTGDGVRFAGWVDDGALEGLYRMATCFAFPSLAEGFGLPVLEAMLRGVPVACSNTTSLPEVAGNAALYFDPTDPTAIKAAVERLLREPELRERLRVAGKAQARKFSWHTTAYATLATYERALA